MSDILSKEHLKKVVVKASNKTLRVLETKLENKIASLEKLVPWPALIHSVAGDLEIVWAEQKRREQQRNDKR
jgi:hypothetical protein